MTIRPFATALLAASLVASAAAKDAVAPADMPQDTPEAALRKAIAFIDAGDSEGFITQMTDPTFVAEKREAGKLQQVIDGFIAKKGGEVKAVMARAVDVAPDMVPADGDRPAAAVYVLPVAGPTKAEFRLNKEPRKKRKKYLTLIEVDGRWHLSNETKPPKGWKPRTEE